MQKNLIKYIVLAVMVIAGVLWYLLSCEVVPGQSGKLVYELEKESDAYTGMSVVEVPDVIDESAQTTVSMIKVHVCGEVFNPGVYELENGARVVQALEAAGGVTPEAMEDYLNLASVVRDGERVYVPSEKEVDLGFAESEAYNNAADKDREDKVNINTATKTELMQLPGIGESKAESIIAYREANGNFKNIEDIMLISGIKEGMFNRVKDYIKVQN